MQDASGREAYHEKNIRISALVSDFAGSSGIRTESVFEQKERLYASGNAASVYSSHSLAGNIGKVKSVGRAGDVAADRIRCNVFIEKGLLQNCNSPIFYGQTSFLNTAKSNAWTVWSVLLSAKSSSKIYANPL